MANASGDVEAIQRRMAQIRRELHENVQGVMAGATAAFDWKYYVRLYPWTAMSAAFALGYLVVPRRRAPRETVVAETTKTPRKESSRIEEEKKTASRRFGALGMALGFLGPIAVRAAQNYASQYIENWILQQQGPSAPPFYGGVRPTPEEEPHSAVRRRQPGRGMGN